MPTCRQTEKQSSKRSGIFWSCQFQLQTLTGSILGAELLPDLHSLSRST